MSDVLFIQENGLAEFLGVEALSAFLKQNGYSVDLILLSHTEDYVEYIKKTDPKVIAFSVLTGNHGTYYHVSSILEKEFPDKIILMGGPHVTYYPESLEYANVDIYCIGDGEYPLLELLNRLRKEKEYNDIPGLWVKEGDNIFKNDPMLTIKDINELPIPDRGIYYDKYKFMRDLSTKRFVASRGCPFPCTYCFNHVRLDMYGKFMPATRMKSADTVIREIQEVKEKYPMHGVHFSDETFGLDRDFLLDFCEKYKKGIGLPFSFLMRFDLIEEDKIDLLKDAGCSGIEIGLESGSERVRRDILKKPVSNEKIKKASKILKKNGIKIYTSNIIGIPTESYEEMLETLRLNREIRVDYTDCNIFIPFPKLWLTNKSKETGHLTDDYDEEKIVKGETVPKTKSYYENDVLNLKHLFFLFAKLPIPMKVIRFLLKRRHNKLYELVSSLEMYKSIRFFRIRFMTGLRFFLNTCFSAKGVIFGLKEE
ncbi:MAG: B12-binding domain-containing radical SAM protein [Candidatus Omnitrophota bacterium]